MTKTFDVYTSKGRYTADELQCENISRREARERLETYRELSPFAWMVPHGASPNKLSIWNMARIDQRKAARIYFKRALLFLPVLFLLVAALTCGWISRTMERGEEWLGWKLDQLSAYINR